MSRNQRLCDESTEEVSPYDKKIDDFFDGIHRFSDKMSEKTKRFLALHHDPESLWKRGFSRNKEIDQYMNKPYETRSNEEVFPSLPFGLFNRDNALAEFLPKFGANLFDMFDESAGATPYGLYAYQTPSPRAYDTCVEKRGLSLWDSSGYWRCLFPSGAVPTDALEFKRNHFPHRILTRDDFEEHAKGKDASAAIDLGPKGMFFKQYNDYLSWRSSSLREQRDTFEKESLQPQLPPPLQAGSALAGTPLETPKVVGTEVKSFMNSDENEIVQKEIKTEYFSDGTSKTSNIVRKKPIGSDTWDSVTETNEDNKSGWFWN